LRFGNSVDGPDRLLLFSVGNLPAQQPP